jgi:hypothetical protein
MSSRHDEEVSFEDIVPKGKAFTSPRGLKLLARLLSAEVVVARYACRTSEPAALGVRGRDSML